MIKTINLQKIFKTEEVETWALNNVSIEVKHVTLDLSFIQISFNLHFQHITAPTHFYRLFHS